MPRGLAVPDSDPRIVATTLDRMRLGVSIEIVGIGLSLAISPASGIPLPPVVLGTNVVVIVAALCVFGALRRRRIEAATVHWMAMLVWLFPPINTLISFLSTGDTNLVFPIIIELGLAGIIQTSWRHLTASTTVVSLCYFGLALAHHDPDAPLHLSSVLGSTVTALLVGRAIRRSMDSTVLRDDQQIATAALLERELEERRRAEQEREGIRDQFVHAQRMEAVGTLAAGLAHDMNNIIAGILGIAEIAADDTQEPGVRADLQAIAREATRAAELTRGLLAFSRRGQYRKGIVELDTVIAEVEPLLSRMFASRVTLERRGGADLVIDADPAQLGQAIVNLCINGADAMDGRGMLTLTTSLVTLDASLATLFGIAAGPYAAIAVCDTGRGMDESVKKQIFEPFFTTKPVGEGTGLGLAMVYGTVRGHDGAIEVESALGAGSTFTIYLPISASVAVPRTSSPARDTGRNRVPARLALVVDDEPVVRAVVTRILRQMGLSVVGAGDGVEALEVFRARRAEISLVMLDMSMPVMSGAECFRELRRGSQVPIVIASGFADEAETQALLAQGNTAFLEKPFSVDEMRAQVTRVLERAHADDVSAVAAG